MMNLKLHIGNVSTETTQKELHDLFARQGPVMEVRLIVDRSRGRPRGFAFVTMATAEGARAAVEALHGQHLGGHFITVNEARPREDSPEDSDSHGSERSARRSFSKLF